MWQKSYDFENSANSFDEYCGPLSLTTVSGTPNRENIVFRALMMP